MAKSKPFKVEFSGDLTIRAIADSHATLAKALEAHGAVSAQIADDAEVDLTFVQLLVSARRTAEAAGKTFALSRPAAGQLLETLNRGGFVPEADGTSRSFWLAETGIQR